jgi:hypothetical protein
VNISCLNQNAKDEATVIVRQLRGAESEVKALRSMTQNDIDPERNGLYCNRFKWLLNNILETINCVSAF